MKALTSKLKQLLEKLYLTFNLKKHPQPVYVTISLLMLLAMTSTSFAYLGGFEDADGYKPFLNDVANYNAGQYGPNAGGGTYTTITPNTGLWKKLQGPLYPATGTTGGVAYATGHQYYDRTNPNTAEKGLVITTNADGWTAGPQEYSYTLDSYDLGMSPASTSGQLIDMSFWSCARIFGTDEGGGLGAGTIGDTVSFYDSSGNLGFTLGYRQPATTTDYAAYNVNGTWIQSSVAVNPHAYHRWDVLLDLGTQTLSLNIFEAGTLTNLLSGASLTTAMNNLTELRFESTPGVNNAKIWSLDDFEFRVTPEPATLTMIAVPAIMLMRKKRK